MLSTIISIRNPHFSSLFIKEINLEWWGLCFVDSTTPPTQYGDIILLPIVEDNDSSSTNSSDLDIEHLVD